MNSGVEENYKRFKELADRSYMGNQYTFTNFLDMSMLSDFYNQITLPMSHELSIMPGSYTVYGGYEGAERNVIRFGNPQELMYEQPFPVLAVKIKPLNKKFSDELSHRDFLGAVMNLGIERHELGDIIIDGNECFLFALERTAPLILAELTRVRHTSVICEIFEGEVAPAKSKLEEKDITAKSLRVDGIIAKVYNLSRQNSAGLFFEKKVFVNGRLTENESHKILEGDIVSVRGFGRFVINRIGGNTKKGNTIISIGKYGTK